MDPHQVERVAELSAGRIGPVVGEREAAVFIKDEACCRGSGCVSVTVLFIRRRIDVREERVDRSRHVIDPAERADHARLCRGVLLLFCCRASCFCFARYRRPEAHVVPVLRVVLQDLIRIQKRRVDMIKNKLPIVRAGRPVHEPLRLEGLRVQLAEHLEVAGEHAPDGLILVRIDVPGKRHEQTQARLFRAVFMRGIDRGGVACQQLVVLPEVRVRLIHVER